MPALSAGVYAESISNVGLPAEGNPIPIAEQLASEGYECGLWTDNFLFGEEYNYDRGFHGGIQGDKTTVRTVADILEGFDPLYNFAEWTYFNIIGRFLDFSGKDSAVWRSAETLHNSAIRWLDSNRTEDVFCWLHYMDTHHPYMPPAEYLDKVSFNHDWGRAELGEFSQATVYNNGKEATESELEDIRTVYEMTCEYLADEVVNFIGSLKDEGHFDPERDTLVFTADHGESLPPTPYNEIGHKNLREDVVHVPLIISHLGWEPRRISGQVSLIDLMPTLLNIIGQEIPPSAQGTGYEEPEEMVGEKAFFSNGQPWRKVQRGFGLNRGRKSSGYVERQMTNMANHLQNTILLNLKMRVS